MDIFYRNQINAGVLHMVSVPRLVGLATLQFNIPAPEDKTFVRGALITQLTFGQRSNTQFQQSLDNTIYVYSFGDLMGDLTLSGLAFPRSCNGSDNGVSRILDFYATNRVSKRVETLQVTFVSHVIRGYLVGVNMTTVDPSSGLHSFVLLLKTIPASFRRSGAASSSSSSNASERARVNGEQTAEIAEAVGA